MITITKMLISINSMILLSSLNPMKMSFLILIFSFMTFFVINKMSGTSWFPMIFFLLFMGGILIMFLILSSICPNEKSMKTKITLIPLTMMILISPSFLINSKSMTQHSSLKWSMMVDFNMEIMILLILGYFFSFILMVSTKKMAMRSM